MRFAVGFTSAVAVSAVCAVLLGQVVGHLNTTLAWIALATGVLAGGFTALRTEGDWVVKPKSVWGWLVLSVFAFAVWRSFFFLIYSDGHALRVQNVNNLGDLTKHINFIIHLTRTEFWPDNPLLAEGGIHYPFGMDLINVLLVLCGLELFPSLIWVGLLSMIALWAALYRWGGSFAVAAVLFSGGLLGFLIFGEGTVRDYQAAAAWKNIFLSLIVPQRGFLFALPAGLIVMYSLREQLHKQEAIVPLWVGPGLFAVMPLFHLHTFIFLGGLILFWSLFSPVHMRKIVAIRYGPAVLPAFVLAWMVSDGLSGAGSIRWSPGWMAEGGWAGVTFWFVNFGFFLPLFAAVLIISWKNIQQRLWMTPAAVLFVLVSLFAFAPWIWDNTKLYIWAYVCVLPVLGSHLRNMHILPQAGWYCGLFFSGAVSLSGGLLDTGSEVIKRSDLHVTQVLLRGLPHDARIACAPEYNHPAYFLGHKLAAGYDGHLYGHGLDFSSTMEKLDTLMNGASGAEDAARALGATHIVWSPLEESRYPESTGGWQQFSRKIHSLGNTELYQLDYSAGENSGMRP